MQALTIPTSDAKSLTQLQWQDVAVPEPGATQVLLEVRAVGLNPVDVKAIQHGVAGWTYPHIPGVDAAGVITVIGSEVTAFQPGDRVAVHGNLSVNGSFAEVMLADQRALARLPLGVDFATAAASLCAGVTAYQALSYKANLTGVETVLIHGGAGGVGSMAIQLAKLADKRVFTTVSATKQAFVAKLAPDTMIDYQHEDVTARIAALTNGHGVDLILNTIGHSEADFARLAYNGQLISLLDKPTLPAREQAQTVSTVALGGAYGSDDPRQIVNLGQMTSELLRLVAEHQVDPLITKQVAFADIPSALALLAEDNQVGKLVAVQPEP